MRRFFSLFSEKGYCPGRECAAAQLLQLRDLSSSAFKTNCGFVFVCFVFCTIYFDWILNVICCLYCVRCRTSASRSLHASSSRHSLKREFQRNENVDDHKKDQLTWCQMFCVCDLFEPKLYLWLLENRMRKGYNVKLESKRILSLLVEEQKNWCVCLFLINY